MKLTKNQLTNAALIVFFALFLFTPVGFHLRVYVSRLFSFSPSVLAVDKRLVLTDYTWQLIDLEGGPFDFKEVKGKVVLVNFWATWCPPCVAEMPSLQELFDDYGDKVAFVIVAQDEKGKVSDFLNKKGYTFPVYFENSPSPDLLLPEYIPTTYIIGKRGELVVEKTGVANWNSKSTRELLDQLLGED